MKIHFKVEKYHNGRRRRRSSCLESHLYIFQGFVHRRLKLRIWPLRPPCPWGNPARLYTKFQTPVDLSNSKAVCIQSNDSGDRVDNHWNVGGLHNMTSTKSSAAFSFDLGQFKKYWFIVDLKRPSMCRNVWVVQVHLKLSVR